MVRNTGNRMTIRSLREGEQGACLDLWDAGFEDAPRSYFEKYFRDPEWRLEDTVVCEVERRIVSVVHFVRRTVETLDGPRRMAGLANVTTHPGFRGRGYNTACLGESLARQEKDEALDLSLLGTGIHDYYARFGWVRWEYAGLKGMARFISVPPGSIRPAMETDLPAITVLYTAYNQRRPYAVHRTEDYWRYWGHWRPESAWVTERDGVVVGYALARRREDGIGIREIGGDDAAVETLLSALMAQAGRGGFVALHIPPDPVIHYIAEALMTDVELEPIPWWMMRCLRRKAVPTTENGPAPYFYDVDSF